MSEQEPIQVVVEPQVVVVKRGGLSCCGCSCAIPTFVIPVAALVVLASAFGSALALLLILPLGLVGAAQTLGGSRARRSKPAGASARRPSTREHINVTKAFPLWVIGLYQHTLSLDHGPLRRHLPQGYCRYKPSCSEYTRQAIERYGFLQGCRLGVLRILRCHPWSDGGKDEVPELHRESTLVQPRAAGVMDRVGARPRPSPRCAHERTRAPRPR